MPTILSCITQRCSMEESHFGKCFSLVYKNFNKLVDATHIQKYTFLLDNILYCRHMVEFNITDIVKHISTNSPEMAVTGFRKKSSGHTKLGPSQLNKNQVICEWWDEKTKALTNRVFDAGSLILVRKAA